MPGPQPFTAEQATAAFWAKVDKNGPPPPDHPELGPCWLWTAGRFATGYGSLHWRRRARTAHTVAWEMENGPIAAGVQVLHACDVRACIRHLFTGTQADNMADAKAKGRTARGERSGQARLTDGAVHSIRALRADGLLQREIAARFGVGRSTIEDILVGRTWGHI